MIKTKILNRSGEVLFEGDGSVEEVLEKGIRIGKCFFGAYQAVSLETKDGNVVYRRKMNIVAIIREIEK